MTEKTKPSQDIILTKKAAEKILELAKKDNKEEQGLKLFVFPGGCAGVQYGMDFIEKPEEKDITIKQHGVTLYVEKKNMEILKGVKIDFIDTSGATGFKIDNPNIKHGCGCGRDSC